MHGEAGYQADTLAPGLHWACGRGSIAVELREVLHRSGRIAWACVEACDGQPLPSGRIIARQVECDTFQDARAFLENGGERGPQMAVIPPGTYRINPLLFTVTLAEP